MRRRSFLLAAGLAGPSLAQPTSATALAGEVDPAVLLARRLGGVLLGLDTSAEPVAAPVLREVLTAAQRDFSACQYIALAERLPALIAAAEATAGNHPSPVTHQMLAESYNLSTRALIKLVASRSGMARAGDRDRTNDLLAEAEATAARLTGDRGRQQALTANIVSHRVSAAYLLGDAGTALAHAHGLPLAVIPTTERRARLLVDIA
ncbi:MAG: hypothetical protein ACRDTA_09285, partial [Pseudonocardiaceae bacterium]